MLSKLVSDADGRLVAHTYRLGSEVFHLIVDVEWCLSAAGTDKYTICEMFALRRTYKLLLSMKLREGSTRYWLRGCCSILQAEVELLFRDMSQSLRPARDQRIVQLACSGHARATIALSATEAFPTLTAISKAESVFILDDEPPHGRPVGGLSCCFHMYVTVDEVVD